MGTKKFNFTSSGYKKGLKLKQILFAARDMNNNELMFQVRWENHTLELVRSSEVRRKNPQQVIDYYESIMVFGQEIIRVQVSAKVEDLNLLWVPAFQNSI